MILFFNILAICAAAGFSGVMLCIGVTLGGYWQSLTPDNFLDWFAANNQYISNSIVTIFLPTFFGVVGSIWLSRGSSSFKYWLISGLCIVIVAVFTFAFFVPTNNMFASKSIEVSTVSEKLNLWLTIHNARIGFAALAAIFGCLAIHKSA